MMTVTSRGSAAVPARPMCTSGGRSSGRCAPTMTSTTAAAKKPTTTKAGARETRPLLIPGAYDDRPKRDIGRRQRHNGADTRATEAPAVAVAEHIEEREDRRRDGDGRQHAQ